jgi:cell division protein FtsL
MKRSFKQTLIKYKYLISIIVFAVLIGFVGDHCLVKRWAQKQEIADLKSQINEQKRLYDKDKLELERIQNNPEAVKRVAHEKYYMKTEDEDIFVIDDDE